MNVEILSPSIVHPDGYWRSINRLCRLTRPNPHSTSKFGCSMVLLCPFNISVLAFAMRSAPALVRYVPAVNCPAARSYESNSLHPASYTLFGFFKKVNPSRFNRLWTLSVKHPGWGYLNVRNRGTRRRCGLRRPCATWTRYAHPTIIALSSRG